MVETSDRGNSAHVLPTDYHEIVVPMLEQAVRIQTEEALSSQGMPLHQLPDVVLAMFEAEYATSSTIDSVNSEVSTKSGALVRDRQNTFTAPKRMGVSVIASCYHDRIAMKSMDIKPSANGTLKQGQLQTALPKLVRDAIEEARKLGRDAEKYLRTQPATTREHHYYTGQPASATDYMTVKMDPNSQEYRNLILEGLSTIKGLLEAKLSDLGSVNATLTTSQKFLSVFGVLNQGKYDGRGPELKEVRSITKDSRVALEAYVKLNSGVDARFFEGGTGGLESLCFTFFDTTDKKDHKVAIVTGFDSVISAITEHLATKVTERDTDENISALGQSAPVVLSQRAAAYLMYAVTMYTSGSMMLNQMTREDKKTLVSRIGTAILPSYFNIVVNGQQERDGDVSNRYGSMLIDAEGTTVRELKVVEGGVLRMPMATRQNLLPILDDTQYVQRKKAGETKGGRAIHSYDTQDPNPLYGVARRKDVSSEIIAAPTNIDVLEDPRGPQTLDEIVARVGKKDKGLFVESVQAVTFDGEGNIALEMDLGYTIENGIRNSEVRYKQGKIYFNLAEIKDTILALSGPNTAMCVPINAQIASGQVLPISVSSPMIVVSKADFTARSKFGSYEFQSYVDEIGGNRGLMPVYEKLARERTPGLLPSGGPEIFTATNGIARIRQETMPVVSVIPDSDTALKPDYCIGPKGELVPF